MSFCNVHVILQRKYALKVPVLYISWVEHRLNFGDIRLHQTFHFQEHMCEI